MLEIFHALLDLLEGQKGRGGGGGLAPFDVVNPGISVKEGYEI